MINVLYNEYVDEYEKDFDVDFMKESVKLDRVLLALSTVMEKEELDIREAEIRCIEESADMDSLETYYREAAEESEEKSDGLLKKAWDTIKSLFEKIKNFIFGSKQAKILEEKAKKGEDIGVDEEGNVFINKLKTLKSKLGDSASSAFKAFTDQSNWAIAGEIIGAGVAGAGVALTVKGCKKVKAGEVDSLSKYFSSLADSIKNTELKDITNWLKSSGSSIKTILGQVVSNVGGKVKEGTKKVLNGFKSIAGFLRSAAARLLSFVTGKGGSDEKDIGIASKNNDGTLKKKVKDLDPDTRTKFSNEWKQILDEKKKNGTSSKEVAKQVTALHNKYGVVESPDDIMDGELFSEETIDDMFNFELPEEMVEESVSEDIDDIADLLLSL